MRQRDEPTERVRLALATGDRPLPEDVEYLLRQYDALAAAIPILRAAHESQNARLREALRDLDKARAAITAAEE